MENQTYKALIIGKKLQFEKKNMYMVFLNTLQA